MDYALPHAVLAFLQEEHSPNLPKSYFISSSTKSTKITLIYTRRKQEKYRKSKITKRKSKGSDNLHGSSNDTDATSAGKHTKHRERYSSSSTDDYTQRPRSVQSSKYKECAHRKHTRRICASTPGRGYSEAARAREYQRPMGAAKMATDPILRNSINSTPGKDNLTIGHFTANNRDHMDSDSDLSYHYVPLSPSSVLSDRPPTPGRDLNPSNSPRPPTPNANNYASIMSGTNNDLLRPNKGVHHTPSRQPTIEYDDGDLSPPPTPGVRQLKESGSSQSKRKGTTSSTANHNDKSSAAKRNQGADISRVTPPPILIRSPSPELPASLTRSLPPPAVTDKRPSYARNASWDGHRR